MTFSQDENYLMMYYQLVDNNLVRVNNDPHGFYQVYDLVNKQLIKSWDPINNIQWRNFNFPNSLLARYGYYPSLIEQKGFIDEPSLE